VQNRQSATLFKTDLFRKNIEEAYEQMWEIALRGEAPQSFSVTGKLDKDLIVEGSGSELWSP
jgi:hypothetical protein